MVTKQKVTRVVIMGAAGRDFHNFNCVYRDNKEYQVVAFTATQIPDIEGRKYPAKLAGKLYPKGIPIVAEEELPILIDQHDVDEVVFSYSDVGYEYVMSIGAVVNACGADFKLLGAEKTMVKSKKPVIDSRSGREKAKGIQKSNCSVQRLFCPAVTRIVF